MIGPLAIVGNYLSHDYKLFQLGLSYRQIKHPATTTYIATMRKTGHLGGNGRHMDYLVAEFRSYEGTPEALRQSYAAQQVTNPIDGKREDVQLSFEMQDDPYSPDVLKEWEKQQPIVSGKQYYVVYADFYGDEPWFDIRGY